MFFFLIVSEKNIRKGEDVMNCLYFTFFKIMVVFPPKENSEQGKEYQFIEEIAEQIAVEVQLIS